MGTAFESGARQTAKVQYYQFRRCCRSVYEGETGFVITRSFGASTDLGSPFDDRPPDTRCQFMATQMKYRSAHRGNFAVGWHIGSRPRAMRLQRKRGADPLLPGPQITWKSALVSVRFGASVAKLIAPPEALPLLS
ncbi:hypothetical protein MesoLjLb_35780 [Mesorhizobium sp. L-8-3]|nr:hypothetical protein MesoLjLb_35780 [Mesorhizobium sp. L-8-3]